MDVRKDEVSISDRFVYTIKHKPFGSGHTRTEAYIGGHRRFGARFCLECHRDSLCLWGIQN